jgi:hypothetical protein
LAVAVEFPLTVVTLFLLPLLLLVAVGVFTTLPLVAVVRVVEHQDQTPHQERELLVKEIMALSALELFRQTLVPQVVEVELVALVSSQQAVIILVLVVLGLLLQLLALR